MSRGVDDVYLSVFVVDRNVLGENRYATFTLKVVVVEYEFTRSLVLTKEVTCEQHLVYKRCLAMVDVRDNGDIADILHFKI